MHLVIQLRRDCGHYADDLEPAHGSEGAAAVNARDLRKSLDDGSTAVVLCALTFNTHLVPTTLCSARTEVVNTSSKPLYFSKLEIFSCDTAFKYAAGGGPWHP